MAINERRVAVLGAGTIGEALIAGLISGGWRRPDEIVATGRRERVNELRESSAWRRRCRMPTRSPMRP